MSAQETIFGRKVDLETLAAELREYFTAALLAARGWPLETWAEHLAGGLAAALPVILPRHEIVECVVREDCPDYRRCLMEAGEKAKLHCEECGVALEPGVSW